MARTLKYALIGTALATGLVLAAFLLSKAWFFVLAFLSYPFIGLIEDAITRSDSEAIFFAISLPIFEGFMLGAIAGKIVSMLNKNKSKPAMT